MNTLLALSLAITNGVAHIRVSVPAAGVATLQISRDARFWVPISRPVTCAGPCETGFAQKMGGGCGFFRVEWRQR